MGVREDKLLEGLGVTRDFKMVLCLVEFLTWFHASGLEGIGELLLDSHCSLRWRQWGTPSPTEAGKVVEMKCRNPKEEII